MTRILISLLTLLAAVSCSQPAFASNQSPGKHLQKIKVDQRTRRFVVYVPKSLEPGKPLPVVIVLHGAFGDSWSASWDSNMCAQAEKDKFLAVFPRGYGLSSHLFLTWNAGKCCGLSIPKKIDDVAFVRSMLARLEKDYPVDPRRIYVTGISNGGMLAYLLAAEMGDTIAAIAPVESVMMFSPKGQTPPVSVVAFNGTTDNVIPYEGGIGNWCGYKFKCPPVRESIEYWVKNDGCESKPTEEKIKAGTRETFAGGSNGTEVCLYTIEGGQHFWPGGRTIGRFLHSANNAVSATEEMCKFFWHHPKQPR